MIVPLVQDLGCKPAVAGQIGNLLGSCVRVLVQQKWSDDTVIMDRMLELQKKPMESHAMESCWPAPRADVAGHCEAMVGFNVSVLIRCAIDCQQVVSSVRLNHNVQTEKPSQGLTRLAPIDKPTGLDAP